LRELSKQKPRGQTDENLLAEISRLEAGLTVARDDLVRSHIPLSYVETSFSMTDMQAACRLRISGLKSEVKHLDQEIKKNTPELKKVRRQME
jgi:structural maintenance of chromosome 1